MEERCGEHGQSSFVNHSSTSPPDMPLGEDDKSNNRQKRKRTSMEDQSVLEEAYKRNPKPDKAARLDIVRMVNLGEKEVQIWFQNRRQSSRRKSRPLLPHEVAQYQMSRAGTTVPALALTASETGPWETETCQQPPAETAPSGRYQASSCSASPATTMHRALHRPPHQSAAIETPSESFQSHPSYPAPIANMAQPTQDDSPSMQVELPAPTEATVYAQTPIGPTIHSAIPPTRSPPQVAVSQSIGISTADARGVSAPQSSHRKHEASEVGLSDRAAEPRRRLKKAASCIRLSMSSDGNASVVTTDGSSPSPPRAPQIALLPSVSSSVQTARTSQPQQLSNMTSRGSLQRSSSGRARDSRAWEFWCDKESRNELEVKAEKDSGGSAADAIGLLRSASGRSILRALPAKRNSLYSDGATDTKRSKTGHHRSSLQRAKTTVGRLQSKSSTEEPSWKHSKFAYAPLIPGNDSDKENWSPGTRESRANPANGATHVLKDPHRRRTALGENKRAGNVSKVASKGQGPVKSTTVRAEDGENADPEADAELAAFMRGGRQSNSASSEADLDCVQGLLSLSQGNWR